MKSLMENGKEVSRKVISEKKLKEKQDKVVAVGTKEVSQAIASRGSESWKRNLCNFNCLYSKL